MKNSLALAATLALALALPAAPALAQDQSVSVEYSDLDLSTPEGQKALDARVDAAARAVCGVDQGRTGSRIRDKKSHACIESATRQVKAQLSAIMQREGLGG